MDVGLGVRAYRRDIAIEAWLYKWRHGDAPPAYPLDSSSRPRFSAVVRGPQGRNGSLPIGATLREEGCG